MKLRNHPRAQCSVKNFNGWLVLTSCEADTAIISPTGWLFVSGLYNATTRRHVAYFLAEYVPALSFQDAKYLCENKLMYNIYTGEIK